MCFVHVKVIGCKTTGSKHYITVDGAMTELLRPALYGAYHHIELTEPTASSQSDDVSICIKKNV